MHLDFHLHMRPAHYNTILQYSFVGCAFPDYWIDFQLNFAHFAVVK